MTFKMSHQPPQSDSTSNIEISQFYCRLQLTRSWNRNIVSIIIDEATKVHSKKFFLSLPSGLFCVASAISPAYSGTIRSNCIQKWNQNYPMIEWCINEQSNALYNVRRIPNSSIKSRCLSKWGENYTMVEWCYAEQSGARRRLGISDEQQSPRQTGGGCITVGDRTECL